MKNIIALVALVIGINANALVSFNQNYINSSLEQNSLGFNKSACDTTIQDDEEKKKKKKKRHRKNKKQEANGTNLINEKISITEENQPVDKKKKKKK